MNITSTPGQAQVTAEQGLAARSAIHYHTGDDAANETIYLELYERVNVFVTDSTFTLTVTLPSVTEAAGMIFSAYLVTDGGQDITVTDDGDDIDFDDVTFADANDRGLFFSDGLHWHFIDTGETAAE